MNERDSFKSRLGFLLVSAGCAIGIGNVWKFPYVTGEYGGAVFVLFYLLFLVLMGIPVMTMELAVGRASRKSAVKGYAALEKPGSKWHIHGWFCVLGCYLLMMYYTTVSGWMLAYFWKFVNGTFASAKAEGVGAVFGAMLASPWEMGFFMAMTVVGGFLVCGLGLQSGVERITKIMMLCLLALIVVLAVHSAFLEGGGPGLSFYLLPDWERAAEAGIGNVASAAMNQAFFTLSLGIAAIEIFGSYMSDDFTLGGRSRAHRDARYLRRHHGRAHHFPGVLRLRCAAGSGAVAHFYHPSEDLQPHVHGPALGSALLRIHDLCELLDGHGSL